MPSITAVTGDLADQDVDVIVNAADRGVRGGSGGVDAALHRRGGPTILDDCIARFPGGLQTGDAGVTTAGDLRARWIVHAVGPDHTAAADGRAFLASCYRRALSLADGLDAASVAFPLIGSGARGWPHEVAAAVAVATIADTATHVDDVRIVTTDGSSAYSVEAALMQAVPRRILQGIGELHRRGFHQVRVLPGMSPSGGHWRLLVTAGVDLVTLDDHPGQDETYIVYSSGGLNDFAGGYVDATTRPRRVADLVLSALPSLTARSDDPAYVAWFAGLLEIVEGTGQAPVAYADYFDDATGWEIGWGGNNRYPGPPRRSGPS